MKSLYVINQEMQDIASLLEEGELTFELEQALIISQTELQEKAISYAYCIKAADDDVTAINEEIKRLQAIKASKATAIDRMKEAISNAMKLHNIDSVKSPTLSLSFRKSESIEVDEIGQLDPIFLNEKVTITADKIRIKAAIKAGDNITGARISINYNLQIK